MKETGNHIGAWSSWVFRALLFGALFGLAGCATTGSGESRARKTIWQQSDQYVRIEKQDSAAGLIVPANMHPTEISVDRLQSMLNSVELRFPGESKTVQLFNEDELKVLSENIHTGLASAGPDEDVTFAIIGHYVALMGFLKERMVTTGRVFCLDGHLNIIFGEVHRSVKENEDRRLHPFLPGSRVTAARHEWTLTAKPGMEGITMKRPDWVIFPIAGPTVLTPVVAPATVPAAPQSSGSAGTEKKEVVPAGPREKPAISGKKSVEERLMILNELRNKKLITDEEYRAKRLEILNEL
jgi:hypothetical protein